MTIERDRVPSRVAEWLDRAYPTIIDESGKRRRNVEVLDRHPLSELPESYHVARKEIDEEFRSLLLELLDRVIPDVEAALPDSVEVFTELRERILELRTAIYRPGSEFDNRGRAHELLTRLAVENCPPDYKAQIEAAVGECRAAWSDADQAVQGGAAAASQQETLAESSGPRVPATPKSASSRPKRENYECPQCRILFEPIRLDQKYCSPACRTATYRERKQSGAESG